jgi:predicted enzyme related to lactoylglutathione lyase
MIHHKKLWVITAAALLSAGGADAQFPQKEMAPPSVKELTMMAAAVPVTDVARAVDFYTKGMGMAAPVGASPPGETPLNFPGGGVYIILMKARGDGVLAPRTLANRVILAVPDLKALDARLTAVGYHLSGKINDVAQYHVAVGMVQDPDGNYFELVQRTP